VRHVAVPNGNRDRRSTRGRGRSLGRDRLSRLDRVTTRTVGGRTAIDEGLSVGPGRARDLDAVSVPHPAGDPRLGPAIGLNYAAGNRREGRLPVVSVGERLEPAKGGGRRFCRRSVRGPGPIAGDRLGDCVPVERPEVTVERRHRLPAAGLANRVGVDAAVDEESSREGPSEISRGHVGVDEAVGPRGRVLCGLAHDHLDAAGRHVDEWLRLAEVGALCVPPQLGCQ
jgi:hypothetical protein